MYQPLSIFRHHRPLEEAGDLGFIALSGMLKLFDRLSIFEHTTGRPVRRQVYAPEDASRTLLN